MNIVYELRTMKMLTSRFRDSKLSLTRRTDHFQIFFQMDSLACPLCETLNIHSQKFEDEETIQRTTRYTLT